MGSEMCIRDRQALISSQSGTNQFTYDSDLLNRIRGVVTSAVAQGETLNTEAAVTELTNRIAQLITLTISDSRRGGSVAAANQPRSGLTAELESVVARWVAQSPISTGDAVPEQWVRDLAQRVTPEVAQWRADTQSVDRSVQGLSVQIAPEPVSYTHLRAHETS